MGNNVILTLPNGENKQFTVKDDTRFTVNGNPATVRDLKKGTVVYAERVVEEPMTEFATDTTVVGEAPAPSAAPATAVAQQAPAAPPPAVAQDTPAAPAVAQEQAAAPPPAPVEQAPAPAKTSSRLPVIVGLLLVAGVLVIWVLSRRKS
jgi:cobalamin biosynthesis Mg chelatase CobN